MIELEDNLTRHSLSIKPQKYVLKDSQRHLSIGYKQGSSWKGHLTMKIQGVDCDKLPQVQMGDGIFKNKIVDTAVGDLRLVQFHIFASEERYVVVVSHNKKRKLLELQLNKRKEFVRGKKLTDPGVFPLVLEDGDLQWKV